MRPTARFATWLVIWAFFAGTSVVWAGQSLIFAERLASTSLAAAPKADKPVAEDGRAVVGELLRKARSAMQKGDFDTADALLYEVEQKQVKFGPFNLGDSPKKLRRDLEKMRRGTPPALPSRGAKPPESMEVDDEPGKDDPFGAGRPLADQPEEAPSSIEDQLRARRAAADKKRRPAADTLTPDVAAAEAAAPLPRPRRSSRVDDSPFASKAITTPPTDEQVKSPLSMEVGSDAAPVQTPTAPPAVAAGSARPLLLEARRAIAVGDVRRAARLVLQARGLNQQYGPQDDTPEKIEALLQKHAQLHQASAEKQRTESYRRELANFQMEQSEGLLQAGELESAERLANDASQLDVQFGPYDLQPKQVLGRIAKVRAGGDAALVQTEPSPTDEMPRHLDRKQAKYKQRANEANAKWLNEQARAAIQAGNLDAADRLARESIAAAGNTAGPAQNNSAQLLKEIAEARRRMPPQNPVQPATATTKVPNKNPLRPQAAQSDVQHAVYDQANGPAGQEQERQANQPAAFQFPEEEAEEPFAGAPPAAAPQAAEGPAENQQPDSQQIENPQDAAGPAEPLQQLPPSPARQIIVQAEEALATGDANTAKLLFRKAGQFRQELSPAEQQQLDRRLQELGRVGAPVALPPLGEAAQQPGGAVAADTDDPNAGPPPASPQPPANLPAPAVPPSAAPVPLPLPHQSGALLGEASEAQKLHKRKVYSDLARRESTALQMKEENPKQALDTLRQAREAVETSGLEPRDREIMLRRLAKSTREVEAYIQAHAATIELDEKNQATIDSINREKQVRVEVDAKLAELVDEFNKLMDEQRFAEAEVVAKKAGELDPENAVVKLLKLNAKLQRNYHRQNDIEEQKRDGFVASLAEVERSAIPFDDSQPIVFSKDWPELSARRRRTTEREGPQRNERELEIERKLRTPVSLQFESAALSEVLDHLAKLTEVNLYLDPQGLQAEGITTETPISIDLPQEIMFKSALNLILEPLHLGYVIKDEVLKITSEQFRDGEITTVTYPVADLVIPIPNFAPSSQVGLAASLHDAYNNLGFNNAAGFSAQPLNMYASKDGSPVRANLNPTVLGQSSSASMPSSPGGPPSPAGAGPGGAGAGVQPDFDSLINLITSTIAPTTWDDVGGSGNIEAFRGGNLSLVISQTEDIHDQIKDLLQQLRRLQDLQVTIEVRFITLNDNFFERMGVSFDFELGNRTAGGSNQFGEAAIPTNALTNFTPPPIGTDPTSSFNQSPRNFAQQNFAGNTTVVGQTSPNVFSADLGIPFTQNSFALAVPQFGGFDPTAGASLGFAILSDIEAFFFINAAQGDKRTNVLQAPKVTLFNGQAANVSDTSQSPFVISVIPVVGDFAAAQQPVIVVLSEGTMMTVQATVSSDKRFVRLTVVPFFSTIDEVNTFTFEGTSTSTTTSSSTGTTDNTNARANNNTTVQSGTTVQLPTFAFVTVTTTVSVPDGGTILLGGIKRLQEGRTEAGVPILNKLPYINRLFQNTAIGRTTQSLMMMVTPRIIIQEEEESLLGLPPAAP